MAIAMYNELNKVCLACEAIMLAERTQAYTFVVEFLIKSAPGRTAEDVLVVSGDGFFSQKMIYDFGFTKARYLQDWHHLFASGLQDIFGKSIYEVIHEELSQMIRARSEKYFEEALSNATCLLQRLGERSGEAENKLETFANKRHEYAQYCISRMPGSRGLHGSSNSESNHSSVLCHLNDGHTTHNNYCEEAITLIKDLLARQNKHCNTMNALLFNDTNLLLLEKETLLQSRINVGRSSDLVNALGFLCRPEYERYKQARKEAFQELGHSIASNGTHIIHSNEPNTPQVEFHSIEDRCTSCAQAVAHERQCKHEICLLGFKIDPTRWKKRHRARSRMGVSTFGWVQHGSVPALLGLVETEETLLGDTTVEGTEMNVDDDLERQNVHFPTSTTTSQNDSVLPFDLSSSNCKSLNLASFRQVTSEVSSFYENTNESIQLVVGAMMIKMRDLIVTKGRVDGSIDLNEDLTSEIYTIVNLHNSAFKNSLNPFASERRVQAVTVARPTPTNILNQAQHRLKRKGDQDEMSARKNDERRSLAAGVVAGVKRNKTQRQRKCTLCGLSGHIVRTCPKRADHRKNNGGVPFPEYDMNNPEDRDKLIEVIEKNMTLSRLYDVKPVGVFGQLGVSEYKRSFIIKEAIAPSDGDHLGTTHVSMRSLSYRVQLIGPDGEVDVKMKSAWVTGAVMYDMIGAAGKGLKPKPKFAYDHSSASGPSVRFAGTFGSQMSSGL
jgi:hypothetical protein